MTRKIISMFVVLIAVISTVSAFNGHNVTEGPLTIEIAPVPDIQKYNEPVTITVCLANSSGDSLEVNLLLNGLVDETIALGRTRKTITIPANGKTDCDFSIAFGTGAFSALYPVHIFADFNAEGSDHHAHAVRIVQTDFINQDSPAVEQTLSPVIVSDNGSVNLLSSSSRRVIWQYIDGPQNIMPVNWSGSDQTSGTFAAVENVFRGEFKPALTVHPPWRTRPGTAFIEFRVKLPDTRPLTLTFANAIRDSHEPEPSSDGVTFCVWADSDKIFDRHTDSKSWLPAVVDLSQYAGHEISLKLESHPGPKNDTTCDSSYWAQPMIISGSLPVIKSAQQWQQQRQLAAELIAGKTHQAPNEMSFPLADNYHAAVVLGPNGLLDASIAIGTTDKFVIFDGLDLAILKQQIGKSFSGIKLLKFNLSRLPDNTVQVDHLLSINGKSATLTVSLSPAQTGLKISCECSERITDFALGSADQIADRIYYGHGYCIEKPKPFRAGFGGHNLSTSYVGFDFASGISLVTASDNPPDCLVVNPAAKTYALHTHMNAALTLVPGIGGAFDAALRYRPLYDKKPASAFNRKAGRFVFDIWGGRYADNARAMQKLIDYGLTDSMLTLHVWQWWGYDYRLPDIYPPNPDLGSLADLQALSELCRSHNIPWGLHDNYIDFYPDADDYSYDHIAFTESGQPVKAWINEGRDAQSYRWRPDRIMPFVKRNLDLIKPNLRPDHYFIDVFTSIDCFDFYDRSGAFHSFLETRKCWGEAFSWIRDYLGGSAIMTSEAGDDLLVGYIEGSDCQFLSLSDSPRNFSIHLPCENWERVPWYDVVLHDRFSLHGVGYSGRYQGGRDRQDHGIQSDDYISAELLTGHALMTDIEAFGRDAIRKYYLAQDFIRSIAADTIKSVEFIDDDIHHQKITWNSNAVVYVNRSDKPWHIAGKTLPTFGYYAQSGPIRSSIETIDNIVVEQSSTAGHFYVNARGYSDDSQLEISPSAERIEQLDSNSFKLFINWRIDRPGPKDARVFLHFTDRSSNHKEDIVFQGDFSPSVPIANWSGSVTTGANRIIHIPADIQPGEYNVLVGMWSPKEGRRFRLRGENTGGNRYLIATLTVEKNDNDIATLKLKPHRLQLQKPWGNIARTPVNFGRAATSGAFRCELNGDKLRIIPLPDLDPFEITLDLPAVFRKTAVPVSLTAVTPDGKSIGTVNYTITNNRLTFQAKPGTFAYELNFKP